MLLALSTLLMHDEGGTPAPKGKPAEREALSKESEQ